MPTSDLLVMTGTQVFLFLLMAPVFSFCFNLDTEQPTTFRVDSPGFGHSVIQYAKWLVVGAPQEVKAANQTGGLYRCDYSMRSCEAIPLQVPPEAVNMSLGLSMAATTNPFQLLACGPTVHHACRENMHLTGICFLLASPFRQVQRIPAALQECPKQDQDIVFLIDGSGSISSWDFNKMLNFVKAMMSQFQRPSSQFSLVQFSTKTTQHFTFKDFATSSDPLSLLNSVRQMRGWTFTASAIRLVTDRLFSAAYGARKDASKILIVITDGEKTEKLDYKDVIPQAEAAGIIRYAIGVGSAFRYTNTLQELIDIASTPSKEHVFQVENFDALRDIQKQLKEKIFAIEGTQTISSSSFELEMSQEGFSAVFMPIGSYFGASLCSVDVNGDSSSDLVLIGAPHFYEQTQGGQVSVCPFPQGRAKWQCDAVLRGEPGHPWSRFGAALTALGDVNGDRLADVAIGAPGEQENQGAVYLFHGTSELGISPSHSQRITGAQLSPSLQYFGQSLSGGQDLTQDGLADLAVGAQGHALLLRTRPVLRMGVNIHITPAEITRSVYECQQLGTFPHDLGEATVCLHVSQSPKNQLVNLQSIVTFDLTLDPGRLSPRAIFQETKTRNLTRVRELGLKQHCEAVRLLLPDCVEDSVTPIILRLNFSLVGKPISSLRNLQPMLAVDAQRYFTTSLPFEKNCGADHVCQDDLSISFGVSDLKTLIVGSNLELNLKVRVWNDGEDSYGTSVTFFYPPGLSYQRVTGGQVNNLGQRDLPVSIHISVPAELNQIAVWKDIVVLNPQNPSIQCSSERTAPTESDFLTHLTKKPVLDCSIADCLRFRCDIPSFGIQEELDFILKGNLSFRWVSQTQQKKVLVVSVAEITFNRLVYSQLPGQETFLRAQTELVLEKYEVYNPIPLMVGSSVGGLLLLALITALLYKVGFFKRQYKEMMEGANNQTVPENETGDPQVAQ
ncbi:hypothetical protein G4228_007371 [Cervus hanglu yarkandensis]|nr:hypothetical protein G4228_007371 [Cervus hanglu yarkandensis]